MLDSRSRLALEMPSQPFVPSVAVGPSANGLLQNRQFTMIALQGKNLEGQQR